MISAAASPLAALIRSPSYSKPCSTRKVLTTKMQTSGSRRGSRRVSPEVDLVQTLATTITSKYVAAAQELVKEIPAYLPRINPEAKNLEEALMSVPDLETIPYSVLKQGEGYEIRQVQGHTVAEVTMTGPFSDLQASSKAFNDLAGYLFGSNDQSEAMAMTTPVISAPIVPAPAGADTLSSVAVVGKQNKSTWTMEFVMPKQGRSGELPKPKDKTVRLRDIPPRTMAVAAFPGLPSNSEVERRWILTEHSKNCPFC